jgi:hypothetical protein
MTARHNTLPRKELTVRAAAARKRPEKREL